MPLLSASYPQLTTGPRFLVHSWEIGGPRLRRGYSNFTPRFRPLLGNGPLISVHHSRNTAYSRIIRSAAQMEKMENDAVDPAPVFCSPQFLSEKTRPSHTTIP